MEKITTILGIYMNPFDLYLTVFGPSKNEESYMILVNEKPDIVLTKERSTEIPLMQELKSFLSVVVEEGNKIVKATPGLFSPNQQFLTSEMVDAIISSLEIDFWIKTGSDEWREKFPAKELGIAQA